MKTMRKITATVALGLAMTSAIATETKEMNVLPFSDTEIEVLEAADKGKPVLRQKGDKVYLNLLNLKGDKVRIAVYDSEGRLLFKETVKGDRTVEKAFNFGAAYKDSYSVVVKDSFGTYLEEIVVK